MRGLPSQLRDSLTTVRAHVASRHGAYPHTSAALDELHRALEAEFPRGPAAKAKPRARRVLQRSGDHRQRAWRWYMRHQRLLK